LIDHWDRLKPGQTWEQARLSGLFSLLSRFNEGNVAPVVLGDPGVEAG